MKKLVRNFCISGLLGVLSASFVILINKKRKDNNHLERIEKHKASNEFYEQWLRMLQQGKSIRKFLESRGIKSIAIYGIGEVGRILYDQLLAEGMRVAYGIDQNAQYIFLNGIDVFYMNDIKDDVDAVIVTLPQYYNQIREELKIRLSCPILSIDELIFSL